VRATAATRARRRAQLLLTIQPHAQDVAAQA
jgi:hypothetical protein